MVLLEAMAGGCAVLTTSAKGCAEVVGDAALLVEPGSAEAIGEALRQLIREPETIARYQALGAKRVANFSLERVTAEYEAVFDQVL